MDGIGINARFNVPTSPQIHYYNNQMQTIFICDASNDEIRQMNITTNDYTVTSFVFVQGARALKIDNNGIHMYITSLSHGILRVEVATTITIYYTSGIVLSVIHSLFVSFNLI